LIHLMDREGDTYEVMMAVVDAGDSAVIRCAQNRRVDDPLGTAHQAVRSQPVLGITVVPVRRTATMPARQAIAQVRSLSVTLTPDREKYPHAEPMTWNLVEVYEPNPPAGTEPVHWRLWTLEPIWHDQRARRRCSGTTPTTPPRPKKVPRSPSRYWPTTRILTVTH
jgi:hypothetical protein